MTPREMIRQARAIGESDDRIFNALKTLGILDGAGAVIHPEWLDRDINELRSQVAPAPQTVSQWAETKRGQGIDPTDDLLSIGALQWAAGNELIPVPEVMDSPADLMLKNRPTDDVVPTQAPSGPYVRPPALGIPQAVVGSAFDRSVDMGAVGKVIGAAGNLIANPVPSAKAGVARTAATITQPVVTILGVAAGTDPFDPESVAAMKQAFTMTEDDLHTRLGDDVYANLRSDVMDNVQGILDAIGMMFSVPLTDAELEQLGFIEGQKEIARQAFLRGEMVGAGLLGGTAALINNPIDVFTTRPTTAFMAILPMLKALIALGRITPGLSRLVAKADLLRTRITSSTGTGGIRDVLAEKAATIKRTISDPTAQANPALEMLAQDLVDNPKLAAGQITTAADDVSRGIQAETITPDSVLYPTTRIDTERSMARMATPDANAPQPTMTREQITGLHSFVGLEPLADDALVTTSPYGVMGNVPIRNAKPLAATPAPVQNLVRQIATNLGADPVATLDALDDAFRQESYALLKSSPEVSAAVIQQGKKLGVTTDGMTRMVDAIAKPLDVLDTKDTLNGLSYLKQVAKDVDLDMGGGKSIMLSEIVRDVLTENPALAKQGMSDVIISTGKNLATKASAQRQTSILQSELDRVPYMTKPSMDAATPSPSVELYAQNIVRNQRAGNQLPAVLPFDPEQVASYINVIADPVAPKLARTIRRTYAKPEPALGIPGQGINKGIQSVLKWQAENAKIADDSFRAIERTAKGGLTSRNPAAQINNAVSNLILDSTTTGETPIEVAARVAGDLADMKKPENVGLLKRGRERGLLSTTQVEGEGIKTGLIRQGRGPITAINRVMDAAYSWGDSVFKWSWAKTENARLTRYVLGDKKFKGLKIGQTFDVQPRPNRTVTIRRTPDGYEVATTRVGGRKIEPKWRPVPRESIPDLLADAAVKSAQDRYFDYSTIPNYLMWLRNARIAGLVSPYLTWAYKSLDIPGMKKGLVGDALGGRTHYVTTDLGILGRQAWRDGLEAARRTAMLSAMRTDLLANADTSAMRQWLAYDSGDAPIGLMSLASSPLVVGWKPWGNVNPFGSTDALYRIGTGILSSVLSDPESHRELYMVQTPDGPRYLTDAELPPEERRQRHKISAIVARNANAAPGGWDAEDVLALAGLSGGFLFRFIDDALDDADAGRPVNIPRALRNATPLILGGWGAGVLDIGLSAIDPDSPYSRGSSSRRPAVEGELAEPLVDYAVRTLTSLGYRRAFVADVTTPGGKSKGSTTMFANRLKTAMSAGLQRYRTEWEIAKARHVANPDDPKAKARFDRADRKLSIMTNALNEAVERTQMQLESDIATYRRAMDARRNKYIEPTPVQ